MTTMASGGWRARAAKVVPSPPAVVNSIKRTVTAIEPALAGVAFDYSRVAGLAGLNSSTIFPTRLSLGPFFAYGLEEGLLTVWIMQIVRIDSPLAHLD